MDESLLDGPWRECFELAWEAFCAGTIPLGKVVVDAGRGERSPELVELAERLGPDGRGRGRGARRTW